MRIVKAACFLVIFVCSGCGHEAYWYNEEKTYQRARSDCMDCLYQAQGEISEDDNSTNAPEIDWQTLFEKCMKDKGYKKTWDYKLDYYIRKGFVTYSDDMYPIAGK